MKRIVTTENATGNVVSEWSGGDEQDLEPVVGRTHREVPDDDVSYRGQRWDGAAFVPITQVAPRVIPAEQLMDLLTQAERIAIRQRGRGNAAVLPDDTILDLIHQLDAKQGRGVSLDSAKLSTGLGYLVTVGILTAARKTAILAGTPS